MGLNSVFIYCFGLYLVLNAVILPLLVSNSIVTAIFTELDILQHLYTDSVLFQLYLLFGNQFGAN